MVCSVQLWKPATRVGVWLLSLVWLLQAKRSPQGHFNWSQGGYGKELHLEVCGWLSGCVTSQCAAGWKSRASVPVLVDKYLEGKLKIDEFISHTMPLSEVNRAFELMHQGKR